MNCICKLLTWMRGRRPLGPPASPLVIERKKTSSFVPLSKGGFRGISGAYQIPPKALLDDGCPMTIIASRSIADIKLN
jgi:hypothetical protein